MFVVSFKKNRFGNILTSNDICYGVTSVFIFSTDQSVIGLLNLYVSNPSTCQELLSDWSIYLTVLDMIGWSKINESLLDFDPKHDVFKC